MFKFDNAYRHAPAGAALIGASAEAYPFGTHFAVIYDVEGIPGVGKAVAVYPEDRAPYLHYIPSAGGLAIAADDRPNLAERTASMIAGGHAVLVDVFGVGKAPAPQEGNA